MTCAVEIPTCEPMAFGFRPETHIVHIKQKPREPSASGAFTFWRALLDLNQWPSDS